MDTRKWLSQNSHPAFANHGHQLPPRGLETAYGVNADRWRSSLFAPRVQSISIWGEGRKSSAVPEIPLRVLLESGPLSPSGTSIGRSVALPNPRKTPESPHFGEESDSVIRKKRKEDEFRAEASPTLRFLLRVGGLAYGLRQKDGTSGLQRISR